MKKILIIPALLFCVFVKLATAQTNVSGGIYTNTTWTLANSPYIVTDTVVVFPGVILTIEPGVTVKFEDHKFMEIRQGKLIAQGTSTDSITFTSNSSAPFPGIWKKIFLNASMTSPQMQFTYCNFRYAEFGLNGVGFFLDTILIRNSTFTHNIVGISISSAIFDIDSCNFSFNTFGGNLVNGTVNNSIFSFDSTGIQGYFDCHLSNCQITHNYYHGAKGCLIQNSVIKNNKYGASACGTTNCVIDSNFIGVNMGDAYSCEIKFNTYGVVSGNVLKYNTIENDSIGVYVDPSMNIPDTIYCNKICNNLAFDLFNGNHFNMSATNNFWCTTDSLIIASSVYDGYDNIAQGLVSFMPIDTQQCYLNNIGTFIPPVKNYPLTIYPNPVTDELRIEIIGTNKSKNITQFAITDIFGREIYSAQTNIKSVIINLQSFPSGIYFIKAQLQDGSVTVRKFIKQ